MTQRGRVVVVTGASAGVGRATALEFARTGARIALLARGSEGLKGARAEIESLGGEAIDLSVDVSDADAVAQAADTVEHELGPIDVWVNNAMTSVFSPVKDLKPDEVKRVTDVTYLGVVYGTLAALNRMLPRDRGSIVQVGSALAFQAIPLQAAYCAAKHAIEGFTESLRAELLHDRSNIKLSMVQLPGLNTPQFDWVRSRLPRKGRPVAPVYQPEVAAKGIVWAAEHGRPQVWVGGSTALTLLANRVAPGLVVRYLARTNIDAQQTATPEDPNRPDNLFSPVEGDRGAHGRFDDEAKTTSAQLWASLHKRELLGALAAGAAALAGSRRLGRS